MMPGRDYLKLFRDFQNLRVMVIGDVMVDAYLWGQVDRISPEAPVPVVAVKKRENRLGGAANVALNLRALGAEPLLVSVTGLDERGEAFRQLLEAQGLRSDGLLTCQTRLTTTKFRIFGSNMQLLRVDEETESDLDPSEENRLLEAVENFLQKEKIHVVIFQDYNKGVLTPGVISSVIGMCNRLDIPVAVDPKKKNFSLYRNIALFKPNLKELREGLKMDIRRDNPGEIEQAAGLLQERQNMDIVLTTLSEAGIYYRARTGGQAIVSKFIPAHVRTISDVSGAGDTVISVAALALALKLPPDDLAFLSNLAGGLVCEEVGVVPVNKDKLMQEVLRLLPNP